MAPDSNVARFALVAKGSHQRSLKISTAEDIARCLRQKILLLSHSGPDEATRAVMEHIRSDPERAMAAVIFSTRDYDHARKGLPPRNADDLSGGPVYFHL